MCKRVTFVLAGSLGPVGIVDESELAKPNTEAGTCAKGVAHDSENGGHKEECDQKESPRQRRGLY